MTNDTLAVEPVAFWLTADTKAKALPGPLGSALAEARKAIEPLLVSDTLATPPSATAFWVMPLLITALATATEPPVAVALAMIPSVPELVSDAVASPPVELTNW